MIDCPRYPRRLGQFLLKHIFVSCEVCQCTCDIPTGKYHGGKICCHEVKLSNYKSILALLEFPGANVRYTALQTPLWSCLGKQCLQMLFFFQKTEICAKPAWQLTNDNWSVCCRLCGGTTTACTWNRNWSVILTKSCALLTSHGIVCTAPGLRTSWTSCLFVLVYRRFPLRSLPGWCVSKWSTESLSCPNSTDKVFLQLPGYDDSFKSDSMALYVVQYAISHIFLVLISHILLISIVHKYFYFNSNIHSAIQKKKKSYLLLLFILPSVSSSL